ncbi:MAG TPA: hypothetical protein VFD30_08870 [Terriglobia bacterium]|nr:hypothetical protein [Terriglobia bacterium]
MELLARLLGGLLVFVYHCFDRLVIHGYLSGLSRPEQVVYFFREVVGVPAITKEVLSQGRMITKTGWRPSPATMPSPSNGQSREYGSKIIFSSPCVA